MLSVSAAALMSSAVSLAIEDQKVKPFVGQDLHLAGKQLISYQLSTGEHALVFQNGFSMSIGANQYSSGKAVVWLESVKTEFKGRVRVDYKAKVYLQDNISINRGKAAKTIDLKESTVQPGQAMVVHFEVSGEVFVTAEKREMTDPRRLEIYAKALGAAEPAKPEFVVQPDAIVPEWPPQTKPEPKQVHQVAKKVRPKKPVKVEKVKKQKVVTGKTVVETSAEPDSVEKVFARRTKRPSIAPEIATESQDKKPTFIYPVNLAPAGDKPLQTESIETKDGADVVTIVGRLYVWQKQDEKGGLLELQADNAVIYHSTQKFQPGQNQTETSILGKSAIAAVYMSGDVLMTEGPRTIRADEIYYDFQQNKALVINAVMRNFDVSRGIPIYVKAAKLRQLANNKFSAENVTITTSEFYQPQISLEVSSILITDTTVVDAQTDKVADSSYDAQMRGVRMKVGKKTVARWPHMRSNMQRPDIPLKGVHLGNDNVFGTSLETQWYLARLLGLQEPEGTESTLNLDYYDKRGVGAGAEIEYQRENYFGEVISYIIDDTGEDRLGRDSTRKDLKPPRKLRGRFSWLHRQYLPYNWQLTAGLSYLSDENFLEGYYRREFDIGNDQETYIHLKRIQDNWGLSLLGKARLNDFSDELEEIPSIEFHLTGQSLFDDKFTLYSDTQVSRLRQRIGNEHTTLISEEMFSLASHRTELDMPINVDTFKITPFVAGTFVFDDRSGFTRTLVDGTNAGKFGEDKAYYGEFGVRVTKQPYWKVYPNVKSRLWDLNKLRHIIKPQLIAVLYGESDSVVRQRDTLNLSLSQRLQTKRGPKARQRTVDWMRLDTDVTWVNNSTRASTAGADQFIWNRSIIPTRVLSAPEIFNGDLAASLKRFEMYGPRRNYFGTDYIWRLSDATALLSDMNFDMQSGVVQQFNFGFSHMRWPNLSYYIGSRYLRRVEIMGEKGSNVLTFAATYIIDPRYTLVFSQQFDFDYGANVKSDITLIRRYHRMYCGFTFSADQSLDRQAIVFSIWPQGVPEMALGPRRYMGIGNPADY